MKTLILMAFILTGCASSTGILPMGQDTFLISKKAGTGFGSSTNLRIEAFQEATQYCAAGGKQFQVVKSNESTGPYVLGHYPSAEVEFKCVGGKQAKAD